MATGYRATTHIKHGMGDGNVKEFEAGEAVTGLPTAAMKELWDAGALEQYDTSEEKMSEPETTSTEGTEKSVVTAPDGTAKTTETSSSVQSTESAEGTDGTESTDGPGGPGSAEAPVEQ